jgi:uncharacterized protein YidB (DUF937 family)
MSDMAISGIGLNAMGFNRSFPAGAPSGPPPAGAKEMLSKTADLLGMSADDLKSQLDGGASISDLAKTKGVSHDTLISSLVSDIAANAPSGATAPNLTAMAERIAGHHRGDSTGRPSADGTDPASALTKAVETLAAKLNMSGSDLLSQLEGGSSLSDIAGQAGVSMDQLTADLTQGLMFDARA